MAEENTSMVEDLNRFRDGISVLRVPVLLRSFHSKVEKMQKLVALQVIKQILNAMSHGERELFYYEMVALYQTILQTHFRNQRIDHSTLQQMRAAFVGFLRIARACRPGDKFRVSILVRKMQEALQVDSDFFLKLAPASQLEYVLSCVSGESWWVIRGSRMLMKKMEVASRRCIALLKYGIPYSYERRYFFTRCYEMSFRLEQKGLPKEALHTMIWFQGSLRHQMAFDILTAVFNEHADMKRRILSLMWKTAPHPFISYTEMFRLMSPFFADFPHELRDLCEEYVTCNNVFRVPEVTCPRSLLHLSRIRVRKHLLDLNRLNDGVIEGLDVPRTLKSYLRLDSL